MAISEYRQKLRQKYSSKKSNEEEEKKPTTTNSSGSLSSPNVTQNNNKPSTTKRSAYREKLIAKYKGESTIDTDFIESFVADSSDFFTKLDTYTGEDSDSTPYNTWSNLQPRYHSVKSWFDKNKDKLSDEAYNTFSSYLDTWQKNKNSLDEYFGQFENEDTYRYSVKYSGKSYDLIKETMNELKRGFLDGMNQGEDGAKGEAKLKELEWLQKNAPYLAMNSEDFEEYSSKGASIVNPTLSEASDKGKIFGISLGKGEEIGNIVTFSRDNWENIALGEANTTHDVVGDWRYHHMKDEEVSIYNYLLAKEGKEEAQKYLDSLDEVLNYRVGTMQGENIRGIDNWVGRTLATGLYGAQAGLDQFSTGMQQLFSEKELPTSATQYGSAYIKEDIGGVGEVLYDLTTTTANMAPSILLGSMTGNPVVGAVTLGASAAGNAYGQALKDGYNKTQARNYGILIGVSEAALQSLLGGIGGLGGKITGKTAAASIASIDKAALRVAAKLGINMAGEATEEYLQAILEPVYRNLLLGEDNEIKLVSEEAAYSALLGALSAGLLEGGSTVANEIKFSQFGKTYEGYGQELVAQGLESEAGSLSNTLAQKYQKLLDNGKELTGTQLALLAEANESQIRTEDVSAIQNAAKKRLEELGETGDVERISEVLAKKASGKRLTITEKHAISDSKYGQRVANELDPENIESEGYSSEWAEKLNTNRINVKEYSRLVEDAQIEQETSEASEEQGVTPVAEVAENANLKAVEAPDAATESPVAEEMPQKAVETQESTQNKPASSTSKTDSKTDKVVAKAKAAEKTVSIEAVAAAYGGQAQAVVSTYNIGGGNQDVVNFARQYEMAYNWGYNGVSDAYFSREDTKDLTNYLTDSQRELAYRAGKDAAEASAKNQEIQKKASGREGKGWKEGSVTGHGVAVFEVENAFKGDIRGKAVSALRGMAKVTGIDIVLFKSTPGEHGFLQGGVIDGVDFTDASGGFYWANNKIYIDINAGLDNAIDFGDVAKYTMLRTFGHEFTHFCEKWSPVEYNNFRSLVFEHMTRKGMNVDALIKAQIERTKDENGNPTLSYGEASREVVAEAMTDILPETSFAQELAEKHQNLFQKFLEKLKAFLADIKAYFANIGMNTDLGANALKEEQVDGTVKYIEEIVKMYDNMAIKAVETYQATKNAEANAEAEAAMNEVNVTLDADTNSVAPTSFSLRTWTESEYVKKRDAAAEAIAKKLNISVQKAKDYIDSINSVARLIADDKARLDYDPNIDEKATVIKPNSEYKWTVDMSTLCAKRLLFTGTFDAIQKLLPNTAFDSDDIVRLRSMMEARGLEVACGICYVESTRREIGTITADFIERYKVAQKTGKPISRVNSKGEEVVLTSKGEKFFTEDGYTPTLGELNTTDIDLVKKDHPNVYAAYLAYMNARGQAKPKLLETRAEYKGEILKHFKSKSAVAARNNAGGLRLQSFSDFEVPHLIDMMQIVMDMARVGLKAQAYTKVPNFAEAFGNTGVKINLSLIAKGDGLDADGNLIFDDKEGIDHNEAFRLRDKFSKNVGTILVGKTDAHIIAAMADPRIDYIIPFHKSSWKESLYGALGLTGYADYTEYQNEKPIDKSRKISNFDPSEYWDYTKSGDENAQIYLEKCREDGRIPKFPQFQGYPGYWKLLIDFKMYDNDGVGSPQEVVQPIFDSAANEKILSEYKGGHRSFPVAQDVVSEFVEEYKARETEANKVQYSKRVTDKATLEFLDKQETITTYKTMQIVDGKLYPPMAARTEGQYEDYSVLGEWEEATEHPELIRNGNKYKLDKGRGYGSLEAAYNPYMHSSNLVLNDQFSGAYKRDNLVTVECEVPVSEATSGYHAEYAKDSVGWHPWHTGTVAGQLRHARGIERQVFLSRWIKPVRIVSDSEVATMYKELLDGTGIEVPDNVVTPSLLNELQKAGVPIKESGRVQYSKRDSGYIESGSKAVMTKERIDYLIEDSGAGSRIDYAQAWITSITPTDYLNLTTSERVQNRAVFDEFGSEWNENVNMTNYDYLGQLKKSVRQTPYLAVDIDTGEVVGHDGRHRIRALEKEGIESVEIKVEFRDKDGYLVKYSPDGKRLQKVDALKLINQFGTKQTATINNIIPLNEDYRDEILNNYGEDLAQSKDISYSKRGYWKPNLTAHEWDRLNTLKKKEVETSKNIIDNETKWLYNIGKEKEKPLFAIYSSEDVDNPTVLYASTGDQASLEVGILKKYLEESDDGINGIRETFSAWLKDYGMQQSASVVHRSEAVHRGKADSNDGLDVRTPGRKPSAAFEACLTDLSSRGVRGLNETVQQQRRTNTLSDREVLEIAAIRLNLDDITEGEKAALDIFRERLDKLRGLQVERERLGSLWYEQHFGSGDRSEAPKTLNRMHILDKQVEKAMSEVLSVEDKKVLKRVLQKARAVVKEDATTHYRGIIERRKDRSQQAELRRKIHKVVNELNTLLLRGDKKNHVPESMKKAVAGALDAFNEGNTTPAERAAEIDKQLADLYQQKVDISSKITEENEEAMSAKYLAIESEIQSLEKKKSRSDKMKDRIMDLRQAYAEIQSSDNPDFVYAYDITVANAIDGALEKIGDINLKDMSLDKLEMVYDLYKMILSAVRNANKSFVQGKNESMYSLISRTIGEVKDVGGVRDKLPVFTKGVRKFLWNNQKPIYAMEKIGSNTFTNAFWSLIEGEGQYGKDIDEAAQFVIEQKKKHGYDKWDFDKKYTFTSTSGLEFELTLEQILSLYAYSKREQAHDHLRLGGFVFDSSITTKKKKGHIVKYEVNIAQSHQVSPEALGAIISNLSPEQRAFADEMQKYLSDVMGAKGNEVSMAMYDVRLFKEKHYFPLKSAKQFMFEQNEVAGEVKIKNSSFTNKLTPHANNPVILNNFMDVWAGHVHEMSMYHSFALPLEDFNRIFNGKTRQEEGIAPVSVKSTIQDAYGPEAVSYLRQLIVDLNGGARSDPTESFGKALMGKFKKASVFASASVVIQQPSAILRARAMIGERYFNHLNPKLISLNKEWAQLKKYAPVAIIKEMGHFDTDTGRSTIEYVKDEKTKMQKVDDLFAWAPAKADEWGWVQIWAAVKKETAAQNQSMETSSEEFLKLAGKRFTEVIVKTQVYDSTLSRSAFMRSKSGLTAMATAFMAEPTTSINMLEQCVRELKRGNKKVAFRYFASVYGQVLINSLLVSLVYAARDDDEDETLLEKYFSNFTTKMLDGINPITYYPWLKDIWSISQGFDVERSDMSLINDAFDTLTELYKVLRADIDDMDDEERSEHEKQIVELCWELSGNIGSFFGIPIENVGRDMKAVYNTFKIVSSDSENNASSLWDKIEEAFRNSLPVFGWFEEDSKTDKLYEAIVNGDTAYRERIEATYSSENALKSATRKALKENDPRITEAAEAYLDGDFAKYRSLIYDIRDEGNFVFDTIMGAFESRRNELEKQRGLTEESEFKPDTDELDTVYNTEDYFTAIINGDTAGARAIKEDILKFTNGDEDGFYRKFRTEVQSQYKEGSISYNRAVSLLTSYGDLDEDEADSKVRYWKFKADYPDYDLTESQVASYYDEVEYTGLSINNYVKYIELRKTCKGVDNNNDGKADSGTVKADVMHVIDSLPITNEQKDALYYLNGWSKKTIGEAPWH